MYIRGLFPRKVAELVEAVPIECNHMFVYCILVSNGWMERHELKTRIIRVSNLNNLILEIRKFSREFLSPRKALKDIFVTQKIATM